MLITLVLNVMKIALIVWIVKGIGMQGMHNKIRLNSEQELSIKYAHIRVLFRYRFTNKFM